MQNSVAGFDPRVVAGRHVRTAELERVAQEHAELDDLVAADAGRRSAAADVLVHERVDDLRAEELDGVDGVMLDAEELRDLHRAGHVLQSATARALAPHMRGQPDHLIPLLHQQRGSGGTVQPAAHADGDTEAGGGAGINRCHALE